MTLEAQIASLESLDVLDADLKEVNERLDEERSALGDKKSTLAELEESLARIRQSVEEMERARSELMAETRQMATQVEKSREKLSRCRTEREANAAQREVEEIRKLYRDRELEIEKLVGLSEQARGEVEKIAAEHAAIEAELGASEGDVATRLGELEKNKQEKEDQRKEIVAKIKPQIYRRYEQLRKRRGTGIASTTEGTCSACHMLLPPMLFQQLRRREDFSQCPSCNRILYFKPAPAEAEETADSTSGP